MTHVLRTAREQAVEQLYIRNFGYITELLHTDSHMSVTTDNQIVEGVAKHLADYDKPLTDSAFRAWVTEIVVPLVGYHAIRRVCQPFVRKAIWETLDHAMNPSLYDDYPETVKELEQDVWLWVFLNQKKLQRDRRAKITTRVYARAKVMTMAWMEKHRTRRFAVLRKVYDLPNKKSLAARWAEDEARERAETTRELAEREEIQQAMKKEGLLGDLDL